MILWTASWHPRPPLHACIAVTRTGCSASPHRCGWRSRAPTDEPGHIETVWTALTGSVSRLLSGSNSRVFHVLNNVSGHLRPGTTTLLLAPPGHGKSALLKALSGRIPTNKLAGHVWYGGREIDELHASRLGTARPGGGALTSVCGAVSLTSPFA